MDIIPAIDLLEGNCVRLNQGNYNKVTKFNSDPIAQSLKWREEGAKRLHIVDLDGAKTGLPINDSIIRDIASKVKIPIQVGGGIRSIDRAESLIGYGVDKIIIGTVAIENPEILKSLVKAYPNRVILGIDANQGKVATRGWVKQSNILAKDLASKFSNLEISSIIATDIATDGTLKGPNLNAMKEIAIASQVPIIASGGIGCIADLLSLIPLERYGVKSVIVGRALYDKAIDLKEAIKVMNNININDVKDDNAFFS